MQDECELEPKEQAEPSELRPCPFCGNDDTINLEENETRHPWTVYCGNCDATIGETHTRDEAVVCWNTRPIEDALRAELAAAQKRIEELADLWASSYGPQ